MRRRRLRIPLARLSERARGEGTGHGVTNLFMLRGGEPRHDRLTMDAVFYEVLHDGGIGEGAGVAKVVEFVGGNLA